MFGSGWVAAEDRGLLLLEGIGPAYLATLDVPGINPFEPRHLGPLVHAEPQTINFVARQENVLRRAGAKGRQVLRDLQDWVDGINAYEASPSRRARSCRKAKLTDAIAGFAFIGSIFGNGGGNEVANSDFLARLAAAGSGRTAGLKVFRDLREVNDPEAPTTIKKPFPYDGVPKGPTPGAMVIDPGSESAAATTADGRPGAASHRLASNFIIAGHKHSAERSPARRDGPAARLLLPRDRDAGRPPRRRHRRRGDHRADLAVRVHRPRPGLRLEPDQRRLRERAAVPRAAVQPGREPADPRLEVLRVQGPLPPDEVLRRRSARGRRRPARARAHLLRDRPRSGQRHGDRARPSRTRSRSTARPAATSRRARSR